MIIFLIKQTISDTPISKKSGTVQWSLPRIGGLTPNTTWKDVEKHFATVAKPSITAPWHAIQHGDFCGMFFPINGGSPKWMVYL
jgi:hypothetical protein